MIELRERSFPKLQAHMTYIIAHLVPQNSLWPASGSGLDLADHKWIEKRTSLFCGREGGLSQKVTKGDWGRGVWPILQAKDAEHCA